MLAIIITLWFVCGIIGLAMAISLKVRRKENFGGSIAFFALSGPILLVVLIIVCIEDFS
jgi:hypothetical protein